ncbi:MAG: hydroxymethylglutaryl-CoA reductase, degradative [Thaumarchaeota archaeon]|jgi:hydroxymethylglutaryl-CoA reductase|nr:hydroxymethylglutaryl-CoA reductase, degradative [Candidatus Terraquivivens yellowstonensis]MCL7387426.1 hydroxymethylglutaryl-CoA reductase, degradative [Candidatus Terraquivivens yellowstonensis]MCL7392084.1 hydroxymethylglutaryl-CoA reductase, degradative [Candidatus Terraquivivens yellowstonensis]MCL7395046.1 hydroxymethylglutaryl-CoA reductase, degradative [Candidatus Terraquivivens yellowstonensis]MCL7398243.1 hydroxymethylglutaryl-CoA reductase, degradative [Candidatus Terraquivivens 
MKSSRIPRFYQLSPEERLKYVAEFAELTPEEVELLKKHGGLDLSVANRMIENVIGTFGLPLGIATNFLINGKEYLIPMVIEEPSVVAAASNAARMTREGGGIFSISTEPVMIGQVQVVGIKDIEGARFDVLKVKDEILRMANEKDPVLVSLGGGAKDLEARVVNSPEGPMLIVHLLVDVRDAMGANAVNTMAEAVAPYISQITGGKVYLRILSNLADRRLVRAKTVVPKDAVGGEEVAKGIVYAWAFAAADPYRAATHNKGIMNGVDAVVIATGNDWRAVEAGAHAYAARNGRYEPLSRWELDEHGNLVGTLEMPLALGIVGGATKTNPLARICLKILRVKTASELAEVVGAVGLAQNLAALRALAAEGIQRGHMSLHAKNIAVMAGAVGDEVDKVAELMVKDGVIRLDKAIEILQKLRGRAT